MAGREISMRMNTKMSDEERLEKYSCINHRKIAVQIAVFVKENTQYIKVNPPEWCQVGNAIGRQR
jgi:hypothetical protein